MLFTPPLVEARFIRRYKRFFADVRGLPGSSKGAVEVAHVANTGSLQSALAAEGAACWLEKAQNPERKLRWSLMAIQNPTSWVGVNTALPNSLVREAFEAGRVWADKKDWTHQMEVKISEKSRIDMVLRKGPHSHFIEVKNVTLSREVEGSRHVQFPDSVTERGQKHLDELVEIVKRGDGAELVFVVQRNDGTKFSPAHDIDPVYGEKLIAARKKGVQVRALVVDLSPTEFAISGRELKLDI